MTDSILMLSYNTSDKIGELQDAYFEHLFPILSQAFTDPYHCYLFGKVDRKIQYIEEKKQFQLCNHHNNELIYVYQLTSAQYEHLKFTNI